MKRFIFVAVLALVAGLASAGAYYSAGYHVGGTENIAGGYVRVAIDSGVDAVADTFTSDTISIVSTDGSGYAFVEWRFAIDSLVEPASGAYTVDSTIIIARLFGCYNQPGIWDHLLYTDTLSAKAVAKTADTNAYAFNKNFVPSTGDTINPTFNCLYWQTIIAIPSMDSTGITADTAVTYRMPLQIGLSGTL